MENAAVLAQSLPYIQKFHNKTVVIKYGGNAMTTESLKRAVINNIVLLKCAGINIVLVHGGGPEINDMLKKTGKESRFVNGLRYTDEETVSVVQMVLCGKVNKDLVSLIQRAGGRAVGLCGLDGDLLMAKRLTDGKNDYGLVGDVTAVNPQVINNAISGGYIPVISTLATSPEGVTYNVNADTAAAEIASALGAEKLILLTDICGLMRDRNDPDSLISVVERRQVAGLIDEGVISGGMIPKVECCVSAVENGVSRAHIIDGRIENSILIEMLSDAGIGTMFV